MPRRLKAHPRVTLHDVAASIGMSVSAVSRTFTPGASVSARTRAIVTEAARRLGYRPNAIARSLSTQRSRMIALVVSYLHNQFYPTVIEQISQLLQGYGYRILLFVNEENVSGEQQTDDLILDILDYQVDGIILASALLSSQLATHCTGIGIPVILFNRVSTLSGIHTVTSENHHGGRIAARILIEGGARRIGLIAGLEDSSTSIERERGFTEELREQGLALFARDVGHYDFSAAAQAARRMFAKGLSDSPDALFVANDHMAFGVLDVLRNEFQLRVPEQVQLIGFDNVPQAAWGGYQLSTIEQDAEMMSRAAVSALLGQIESEDAHPPSHILVPVRPVIRNTTK